DLRSAIIRVLILIDFLTSMTLMVFLQMVRFCMWYCLKVIRQEAKALKNTNAKNVDNINATAENYNL
ncbi:MAG TPA: hypothetical protein VJL79_03650, partial [Nitrososphaera sp.]|nr:hypothetical protein [Nitrososphaera sp.]